MDINMKPEEKEFIENSVKYGFKMVDTEDNQPFFPFVLLMPETGQRSTQVLAHVESDGYIDIEKALEQASIVIAEKSEGTIFYSIVWDGYVTISGEKQSCILIEFGNKDDQKLSKVFAQPYLIDSENTVNNNGSILFVQEVENRFFGEPKFGSMLRSEWNLCVSSPFIVFKMVASADGRIDEREFRAFVSMLTDMKDIESKSLKLAFQHGIETHAKQMELLLTDFDPIEALNKVRQIISAHTQDKGQSFCEGLYMLGESVAKSSGGFLGFKSIGKEEKAALDEIKKALCL